MRARRRLSPAGRTGVLTAGLTLFTLVVVAVLLRHQPWAGGESLVQLAAVAVLFAVTERFTVTFPVRRGSHTISLSEIPLVLGLVTMAPATLVLVRVIGGFAGLTMLSGQRGTKLVFNTALYGTQAAAAALLFHLLAGSADPLGPRGWLSCFV